MNVFINAHEINVFRGATLGDAILAYSLRSHRLILAGKLIIIDCYGNPTDPDGPIKEGEAYRIIRNVDFKP